ncbi:MAG: methylmalonyl-CoA epimerase [Bacteroidetes bacterium]|nr:methylmalonyl-CoA epimerase [Bacteroidota bacterium]
MLYKVEHIGIAVKSLDTGIDLYEKLLQTTCYKTELVESENVQTAFFKIGETKIELLASTTVDGVIARFIERKGEGIHHIAYAVDDILFEMNELRLKGFTLLNESPKLGADNKLVCFVSPKDTNGVLVELCMDRPD